MKLCSSSTSRYIAPYIAHPRVQSNKLKVTKGTVDLLVPVCNCLSAVTGLHIQASSSQLRAKWSRWHSCLPPSIQTYLQSFSRNLMGSGIPDITTTSCSYALVVCSQFRAYLYWQHKWNWVLTAFIHSYPNGRQRGGKYNEIQSKAHMVSSQDDFRKK